MLVRPPTWSCTPSCLFNEQARSRVVVKITGCVLTKRNTSARESIELLESLVLSYKSLLCEIARRTDVPGKRVPSRHLWVRSVSAFDRHPRGSWLGVRRWRCSAMRDSVKVAIYNRAYGDFCTRRLGEPEDDRRAYLHIESRGK